MLSLSPKRRLIIKNINYSLHKQIKMKLSKQHLPSHFPIPLPNEMESSIPKAFSVQLETA